MPLINWSDELSVGISEIDQQHQKLIKMINDLADAMRQRQGKEAVDPILKGLLDYTVTHFKNEENYFAKFNYSETDSHKKEHAVFISKIAEFKKDFENNKIGLTTNILNYLSDWLKNHIMGTDKKYTQLFHDNGL